MLNKVILFSFILTLGLLDISSAASGLPAGYSTLNLPALNYLEKPSSQTLSIKLFSAAYSQAEAQYLFENHQDLKNQKAQVIIGVFDRPGFSYIAVPELYYGHGLSWKDNLFTTTLAVGRKKTLENKLDDQFHLGLVNPYFSNDLINYTHEGLTGIHTQLGSSYFKLGLNYHPLFIPNQGPAIKEKEGRLIGATPWILRTPEKFVYNGQETQIHYSIDDSHLEDIVNHDGYSTSLTLGELEKLHWQINLSYANTPMNEVVLSRSALADLNLNSVVKVYPVVRYSEKIGTDITFKNDNLSYFISYLVDRPKNKLEPDRAVQVFEPIQGYGAGLQWDLSSFLQRYMVLEAYYGYFTGGEIRDLNSDGSDNYFTITKRRLLYQEPLNIRFEFETFPFTQRPTLLSFNWIYDRAQNGSILSFKLQHQPLSRFYLSLGFDVLGVADESASTDYFLTQHSADDRLTGGLEYVF